MAHTILQYHHHPAEGCGLWIVEIHILLRMMCVRLHLASISYSLSFKNRMCARREYVRHHIVNLDCCQRSFRNFNKCHHLFHFVLNILWGFVTENVRQSKFMCHAECVMYFFFFLSYYLYYWCLLMYPHSAYTLHVYRLPRTSFHLHQCLATCF